jgi:hypothetical protein
MIFDEKVPSLKWTIKRKESLTNYFLVELIPSIISGLEE